MYNDKSVFERGPRSHRARGGPINGRERATRGVLRVSCWVARLEGKNEVGRGAGEAGVFSGVNLPSTLEVPIHSAHSTSKRGTNVVGNNSESFAWVSSAGVPSEGMVISLMPSTVSHMKPSAGVMEPADSGKAKETQPPADSARQEDKEPVKGPASVSSRVVSVEPGQ